MEKAVLESLRNAVCNMNCRIKRDFSRWSGSVHGRAPRSIVPVDVLHRRIQVGAGWPLHVIRPWPLAAERAFFARMVPLVKHEVQL